MKVRSAASKKKQSEERRNFYKSEDWEAYSSLVEKAL